MSKPFAFASSVPSGPSILREKEKALKEEYAKVVEEMSLMEQQYRLNSQRKKGTEERKAKKGLEKKLANYRLEIAGVENRAANDKREHATRIEKIESKLKKIKDDYEATLSLLEAKIERLKKEYQSEKEALEAKSKLEEKLRDEVDTRVEEKMASYYRPILESCLEPEAVEEEVNMPPSYDKLRARKLNLEGSLSSVQRNIRICEEAEATPSPPSDFLRQSQEKVRQEAEAALDAKFAAKEAELSKMREQARREAAESARLAEQRREAERLEKLEEIERSRGANRAVEESKVIPKLPSPKEREREERRLRIHLEEMRKSEEYKMATSSEVSESTLADDVASVASDDSGTSDLTYPPPRHRMFQQNEALPAHPPVLGTTKRKVKVVKYRK